MKKTKNFYFEKDRGNVVDLTSAVEKNTNLEVDVRASAKVLIVHLPNGNPFNEDYIQAFESEGFSRCNLFLAEVRYSKNRFFFIL